MDKMSRGRLPSVEKLRELRRAGFRLKDIANIYRVTVGAVRNKLSESDENSYKSPNSDRAFTSAGKVPVEHRDTGEGIGISSPGHILNVRRPCKIPKDLRREWRLDRWNPGDE